MTFLACALHQLFVRSVRLGASWSVLFACLCLHTPQLLAASALLSPCPYGRTSVHAAASWHHSVESFLLHGQFALSTTLSNSYKLVRAPRLLCRHWPPHRSPMVQRLHVLCPAHSYHTVPSTGSGGPTRNVTGDVMSTSLAEAATQLSFLEFFERCILPGALPPRPQPSPTLLLGCRYGDSFTQCRFCRCHHPTPAHGVLSRVHLL